MHLPATPSILYVHNWCSRALDWVPVFQRQPLPASSSSRRGQSKGRMPSNVVALMSFGFTALVIITVTVTTQYGSPHAAEWTRVPKLRSVRRKFEVNRSAPNLNHNGGIENRSLSAPNFYHNQRENSSSCYSNYSLWRQQVECEGKKPLLTCKRTRDVACTLR